MSDLKEEIKQAVADYNLNIEKFNEGNSAAGTRARKALLTLSKLSKDARDYITSTKNQRKG